jgi:hypothetical protein
MCVTPLLYNCDTNLKVCCPLTYKLEFSNNEYLCVPTCNWGDNSTFLCQQKYCNIFNESMAVNQFSNK